MAKTGKKSSQSRENKARPAPYPKKARVEVTYENGNGSSASSSSRPATVQAEVVKVESVATDPTAIPPQPSKSVDKGKARAVDQSQSAFTPGTFVVVAGSYEKLLYGLEGSLPLAAPAGNGTDRDEGKTEIKPIFIFPAHLACVKAVAASPGGKWLATGSEDEFVKVWDLRRRREMGSLSQHTGECPSAHIFAGTHHLSHSLFSVAVKAGHRPKLTYQALSPLSTSHPPPISYRLL